MTWKRTVPRSDGGVPDAGSPEPLGGEVIERRVRAGFRKMDSMAAPALAAESGELTIVPPRFEKIYRGWLGDIRDWCISRQLWWGHRSPCGTCTRAMRLARARSGEAPRARATTSSREARRRRGRTRGERRRARRLGVRAVPGGGRPGHVVQLRLWPFSTLGWPDEEPMITRSSSPPR